VPLTLVIGNKNYSSWSLRAWLVLSHFEINFEEVLIPLRQADSLARKLEYSPAGRVPILIDGDLRIWDSLAIIEYLAERFPEKPIWPTQREARARARSVSAVMHSSFDALRDQLPMDARARLDSVGHGPELEADIARVREIWRDCRRGFGVDGSFLFGEFTAADAMFAPVVSRFLTYGVGLDGAEAEYARAVLTVPAVEAWMAAARKEPWTIAL
jgi:glutathione S-transferase